MAQLTYIDLFAGCGGLSVGFKKQRFRPVLAVEADPDAADTYRRNVHKSVISKKIEDVADGEFPKATVVIGGTPCQGFSLIGSRDPDDPRNALWKQFVRVIKLSGASVFVLENVPLFLKSDQHTHFMNAVRRSGFKVTEGVLCAADFGVPQLRNRAFMIGSRYWHPHMPDPSHGVDSADQTPWTTVQEALEGVSAVPTGKNWHRPRHVWPISLERYKAVPSPGGNRFDMQTKLDELGRGDLVPPCWRKKTSGTGDVFGRMWWDRPAPTVRTEFYKPEKGRYLHPVEHRPITPREAARLQSFDDNFRFPEKQTLASVARQIGNAVPPLLAAAVAAAVRQHLYEAWGRSAPAGPRQLELVSEQATA